MITENILVDFHTMELLEKYKKKKIIIYGAGFFGAKVVENLKAYGITAEYFIDMYKYIPEYLEVPVIRCKNLAELDELQNYLVIVTVTDESEHDWICSILKKYGIGKVICKHIKSDDESMTDDDYIYESLTGRNRFGRIKKSEDGLETKFLDINLLFKTDGNLLLMDDQYLPYFDFFEGRKSNTNTLIFPNVERFREANSIYKILHKIWENGLTESYYPVIQYDEKANKYYVIGNMEVALFQISKNYSHIKCFVKGKKSEFSEDDSKKVLHHLINDNDVTHLYTPIPIEEFYNIPAKRELGGLTRARELTAWILQNNMPIREMSVLDAGSYLGYFAQLFERIGASHVLAVERNKAYFEICNEIKKYVGSNIETRYCSIEDIPKKERYDITVLFSVLYWHLNTEVGLKIMDVINNVTKSYLFWESGTDIEYEKRYIFEHSDFKSYKLITHTYGTGKLRELGVFKK